MNYTTIKKCPPGNQFLSALRNSTPHKTKQDKKYWEEIYWIIYVQQCVVYNWIEVHHNFREARKWTDYWTISNTWWHRSPNIVLTLYVQFKSLNIYVSVGLWWLFTNISVSNSNRRIIDDNRPLLQTLVNQNDSQPNSQHCAQHKFSTRPSRKGLRLSLKNAKDKLNHEPRKTKTLTGFTLSIIMFQKFMNKKDFHPGSKWNIQRVNNIWYSW